MIFLITDKLINWQCFWAINHIAFFLCSLSIPDDDCCPSVSPCVSPLLHPPPPPRPLSTHCFLSLSFFVPSFLSKHSPSLSSVSVCSCLIPLSEGLHSLIAAWQKPPFEDLYSTFYIYVYVWTNSVNRSVSQFVRCVFLLTPGWTLPSKLSVVTNTVTSSVCLHQGVGHFQLCQFWKYNV